MWMTCRSDLPDDVILPTRSLWLGQKQRSQLKTTCHYSPGFSLQRRLVWRRLWCIDGLRQWCVWQHSFDEVGCVRSKGADRAGLCVHLAYAFCSLSYISLMVRVWEWTKKTFLKSWGSRCDTYSAWIRGRKYHTGPRSQAIVLEEHGTAVVIWIKKTWVKVGWEGSWGVGVCSMLLDHSMNTMTHIHCLQHSLGPCI